MSWSQAIAHLGRSVAIWRKSGFKLADDEVYLQRIDVCGACPADQFEKFQCKHCKCVVYAKARLATETCPLGFWKAVVSP